MCASCNTFEGKSMAFLRREGSARHLLECCGCRASRTLPRRFHLGVALDYLKEVERHGRCRRRPQAHGSEFVHGVHRISFYCHAHASRAVWTKDVTVAEVAALVRTFVEDILTGGSVGDGPAGPTLRR